MSVAELENEAPSHASAMTVACDSAEHRDLLGRLLDEMLNSLLLTATTASIANAVFAARPGCSRRMIATYLPPAPVYFPKARLSLGRTAAPSATLHSMSAYYASLQMLTDLTVKLTDGGLETGGDVSIAPIADAWQSLAHAGLEALEFSLPMFGTEIVEQAQSRIDMASLLLAKVERGGTPCIDDYGTVTLPIGADRRRSARGAKNLQAFFRIGESLQRAAVINASEFGLGVLGLKDVAEGERIHLLIKPGLNITGSVVWADGDRHGIKLDNPLPPDSEWLGRMH